MRVAELIKAQVEAETDIVVVSLGPMNSTKYPCAEFYWSGGENKRASGNGNVIDWRGFFTLRLISGAPDRVMAAYEELLLL